MYDVRIKAVLNGWTVKVGCQEVLNGWIVKVGRQEVVFTKRQDLMSDLDAYLRNPTKRLNGS